MAKLGATPIPPPRTLEEQMAFLRAWNSEALRRYRAKGEQYAGKDASARLSKSMPNTRRRPA